MGQWQSQTRKMNRHYQSIIKGDGGLIYNDWPYLANSVYIYNRYGNNLYLYMFTNPEDPTLNKFEVQGGFTYYDENNNYVWDEAVYINFYFATEKVKSAKRVTKTIDGVEYGAIEVVVPIDMIADVTDSLFNATTQEPDIKPFVGTVKEIVVTLTDVIDYQRKLIVEYRGTDGPYNYINDIINREVYETIYV